MENLTDNALPPLPPQRKFALGSALRHRNYRLFFTGQGLSLIGTWMQSTALPWLVYEETHSTTLLGVLGFASAILSFGVAPLAGVFADHHDRRRILYVTQSLAMTQALILAALTLTGVIQVWHIVLLAMFSGLIMGFDVPARQSFVVDIVGDKQDLPNAIALNSFIFNSARMVGPAVAGLLISILGDSRRGEGIIFLINAASFLTLLAALPAMKIIPRPRPAETPRVLHSLKEGFDYAIGFRPILALLMLLSFVTLVGAQYTVLLPDFAQEVLHGNSRTYGFMISSIGVGALCGALFLARRRSVLGLEKVVAVAPLIFGAGLVGFSFSRWIPLSLALLLVSGLGIMIQMAGSNTLLQTIVDDDKRGRVMSFYAMAFMGAAPFGSLIVGALAAKISSPTTVLIGGCLCMAASLAFMRVLPAFRAMVRPVFERMGILPPASP